MNWTGWLASCWIAHLHLPVLNYKHPMPHTAFCVGSGDLNSGHHVCAASTVLTEPRLHQFSSYVTTEHTHRLHTPALHVSHVDKSTGETTLSSSE